MENLITDDDRRHAAGTAKADAERVVAGIGIGAGAPPTPEERVVNAETPETLWRLQQVTRADLDELRAVIENVIECGDDMCALLAPIHGEVKTWRLVSAKARGNLVPIEARHVTAVEARNGVLAAQVKTLHEQRESLQRDVARLERTTSRLAESGIAALEWIEHLAVMLPVGQVRADALAWVRAQKNASEDIPF